MKYIRTKGGRIFENHNNLQIIDNTLCKMQNGKVWLILGEILKQADTIEELCDEFVMLRLKDELNDNKPLIFTKLDLAKSYFKRYLGYAIYGAIWTKWGLKYVAKMNDKGELELL